jgi:hypothetical protein
MGAAVVERPTAIRTMWVFVAALAAALTSVVPAGAPAHADTTRAACPDRWVPPTDFTDEGDTHATGIRCLVWYGLAEGRTAELYGTGATVTRGQLASLLARMLETAGVELTTPAEPAFEDSAGSVHGERLEQLGAIGVFDGDADGFVLPGEPISRAQLASVLRRALEHVEERPLPEGEVTFTDTSGSVHADAIHAIAGIGLVQGVGDGRFAPGDGSTRGAVATVLARVLDRFVDDGRLEVPDPPELRWEVSELPAAVRDEMVGVSWHEGCPVGLDHLRLVVLTHRGFDGRLHRGELVVHRAVTADLRTVFQAAYDDDFPLAKVVRVDAYGGSDDRSMDDNNTHAFNCRRITGGSSWSEHAYGTAIDLNPVQNPYVRGDTVLPEAGRDYLDRSDVRPGMLVEGDAVVSAFDARGWTWGGRWNTLKDYQHFEWPR